MSNNMSLFDSKKSLNFNPPDFSNKIPNRRKSEINKISNNVKILSNEINLQQKRSSFNDDDNVDDVISNLFKKDAELLVGTKNNSIFEDFNFMKKSLDSKSDRKSIQKKKKSLLEEKKFNLDIKQNNSLIKTTNQGFDYNKPDNSIFQRNLTEFYYKDNEDNNYQNASSKKLKKIKISTMEKNPKNLNFYEKNLFYKQKRELGLEMIRKKIKIEENENRKLPDLTKVTKEIIKEKFNDSKPLYLRVDEEVGKKNRYIYSLKKHYTGESKNNKYKKKNYSNILNDDSYNLTKSNEIHNTIKNTIGNSNNMLITHNKTPDRGHNNSFQKIFNGINTEILNNTYLITKNYELKNELNNDNFLLETSVIKDTKFNNKGHLEFLKKKKEIINSILKDKYHLDDSINIVEKEQKDKLDVHYPQRSLDWVENKINWKVNLELKKNKQIEFEEKKENKKMMNLFKPRINKNSSKIVEEKNKINNSLSVSHIQHDENDNHFINSNLEGNFQDYYYFPNSQRPPLEKDVFQKLYDKRFDSANKIKKIEREIEYDFSPKINYDYKPENKSNNLPSEPNRKKKIIQIPKPYKPIIEYNQNKDMKVETKSRRFEIKKIKNEEINRSHYKKNKSLSELLDEIYHDDDKSNKNDINHKRIISETNQLYKLNIRSSSAWDKNKENSVYYNQKFVKFFLK